MGRNRKSQDNTVSVSWPMDENEPWIPVARRLGRHNTSVQFIEMRLKNGRLEMDYQFHAGGGQLHGTMTFPFEDGDEVSQVAERLSKLGEAAFHNMRRARD